jgi:3-methylcrotonyl-CoA carboxylase alpha subunit
VSRFYDSLIAKVIVTAPNREMALTRLIAALEDFHIIGVKTNIRYLIDVVRHEGFASGDFDTGFLGREFEGYTGQPETLPVELADLMAAAQLTSAGTVAPTSGSAVTSQPAPAWATSDGWRNAKS